MINSKCGTMLASSWKFWISFGSLLSDETHLSRCVMFATELSLTGHLLGHLNSGRIESCRPQDLWLTIEDAYR